MASRKPLAFHANPNFIFPSSSSSIAASDSSDSLNLFEFDEADIWTSGSASNQADFRKVFPNSNSKKFSNRIAPSSAAKVKVKASSSLPLNIPDWSKILQSDRSKNGRRGKEEEFYEDSDGDGDEEISRVPPHEYLARRRGDSFSVHEGIGRTLKGRDLRRVRNAIWKKTGFED